MKKVKAKLGRLGIRTIFYLDDILVLGSTFKICLSNLRDALVVDEGRLHHQLGEVKPHPTTNFTFLGMLWDSVEGALSLPQDKLQHLHMQAAFLLDAPAPTCRQVMVLTGLVAAFLKAVPLLRLKGRYIQLSLNSSEDGSSSPRGKARLPLDDAAPVVRLPRSPVAADGGRLRHRGPDGRLRPRVRGLVPGPSLQQGVG
jgi:hypothetical protein